MKAQDSVTGAAARALITERCQRAYLHDIRGGLQALSGALELLGRLAQGGDVDRAMADRAIGVAKRALAHHERAMLSLVREITAAPESEEQVDLRALVEEVLTFLRNDFASRQVAAHFAHRAEISIELVRNQIRVVLLGLLTRCIDALPAGAELAIGLERRDGSAVLTLRSSGIESAFREPEPVLEMMRAWASSRGGHLDSGPEPGMLELHLPLQPQAPG